MQFHNVSLVMMLFSGFIVPNELITCSDSMMVLGTYLESVTRSDVFFLNSWFLPNFALNLILTLNFNHD